MILIYLAVQIKCMITLLTYIPISVLET